MKATKAVKEIKFIIQSKAELMQFLIEKLTGKSRDNIKSLLRNKMILVNGKTQTHFKFPLEKGDVLLIGKKEIQEKIIPGLKIIFEDDEIIVVNKPAGLLTISTSKEKNKTLFHALSLHVKKNNPDSKVFIVHRLDRETSGLLLFAKNERTKMKLQKNWNETVLERKYVALVEGKVKEQKNTILSYLKESKALKVHSSQNPSYGDKAITHYTVLEYLKNTSRVELELETGRKNQIRVHMQEIGHPIVGDKKYGAKTPMLGRIALHAKSLSFTHPKTGKIERFESKVPF
jgi:23S rRNA pseudouridine1911/1915/1917 synthase